MAEDFHPLGQPCEYCGEPVWNHTPNELKSCVMDLKQREHMDRELLRWAADSQPLGAPGVEP